eukprot:Sspe_Gene.80742::Locus_51124_Transcript_1_1_Confidence_1.000_Length_1365::g.80742::m.80742
MRCGRPAFCTSNIVQHWPKQGIPSWYFSTDPSLGYVAKRNFPVKDISGIGPLRDYKVAHYLEKCFLTSNPTPAAVSAELNRLREGGSEVGIRSYEAVCTFFAQQRNVAEVARLLEELPRRQVRVDTMFGERVMKFLVRLGLTSAVKKMLDAMIMAGMRPTRESYFLLMRLYAKKGEGEAVRRIYNVMLQRGMAPRDRHYELLAAVASAPAEAAKILRSVSEFRASSVLALLQSCCTPPGHSATALRIYHAFQSELKWCVHFHHLVLEAHSVANDSVGLLMVYRDMMQSGAEMGHRGHAMVIGMCATMLLQRGGRRAGLWREAGEEVYRSAGVPSRSILLSLMRLRVGDRDLKAALDVVSECERHGLVVDSQMAAMVSSLLPKEHTPVPDVDCPSGLDDMTEECG